MGWDPACNKKIISNIEQGMSNAEAIWQRDKTSSFEIPCSMFDIPSASMASLLFSNYRQQKNWLNTYSGFPFPVEKRGKWFLFKDLHTQYHAIFEK
jgi:hypothetical protein